MQNAAMFWTGGKDCSRALYEAGRDGYGVRCLVPFTPVNQNILAHPPLWGRDRLVLLQQQLANGFKAIYSCVNTRWLTVAWLGRELDDAAIADLRSVRDRTGLDLCGEEGEYHTLVTGGPSYTRPIRILSHSKRTRDWLACMEIHELELAAP